MTTASRETQELMQNLLKHQEVVSLDDVRVEDRIIRHMSIDTRKAGRVSALCMGADEAPGVFEFYSQGLSEKPRKLFAPYPLFHTPPQSAKELRDRIEEWKKEDDWVVLILVQDGKTIGLALLKRFRSEQATSAVVIRDEFLKKGLGYLIQSLIVEQARLLGLKSFHVKIVSDNVGSLKVHEKCGFRMTRVLPPMYEDTLQYLKEEDIRNGAEPVERHLVEMVIDLK